MLVKFKFATSLVLVLFGLATGCIYIPTPDHGPMGQAGFISQESIAALEPGTTTRADVLLQFGDPWRSFRNDRFFAYKWKEIQGYLLFGGGYVAYAAPNVDTHILCFEFANNNQLVQVKEFQAGWLGDVVGDTDAKMSEWIETRVAGRGIDEPRNMEEE